MRETYLYVHHAPLQVQKWRTAASVTWVFLISPAVTLLLLFFARISFLQPLEWITDFLLASLKLSTWFYVGVTCVVFAVLSAWNSSFYTVRPVILTTRFSHLVHALNVRHILHACGHGLASAVLAWCYTSILNNQFSSLSTSCRSESPSWCLNEKHLFLVLHGFYLGFLYAVEFIGQGRNHLQFPIIQQPKFFTVKSEIYNLILSSVKCSLRKMRYYYVLYYLFLGPFCRQWMNNNMNLKDGEDALGFVGFLSIRLFWHTFLCGTWMIFMLDLARILYTVYQTEPFEFSISAPFDGKADLCLHKAMACSTTPLVQHLAYLDLSLLAKQNFHRRRELFSLSQPGGHPHNWNSVSSECFSSLQRFSDRISAYNDKVSVASGQARQISGDKTPLTKYPGEKSGTEGALDLKHRKAPIATLGADMISPNKNGAGEASVLKQKPTLLAKVKERFKKRKAVAYFSNELPESQSGELFTDVQIYIWAVEALTDLTVSSFNEDKFGVVQKSLPTIVTNLLQLLESVEKFSKIAPGPAKKEGVKGQQATALRQSLKTCLKTAMYRIVNTFGKHISCVPLSPEHSRRLHQFVEYKE